MGRRSGTNQNYDWTTLVRSAHGTKGSDTALAADSILQFPMAAASIYLIDLFVMTAVDSGTPGIKFRYNVNSATPQNLYMLAEYTATLVGAASAPTISTKFDNSTTGSTLTSTGSFFGMVRMRGQVKTHATNASTFEFQWAQNTSSVDLSYVALGSRLKYVLV